MPKKAKDLKIAKLKKSPAKKAAKIKVEKQNGLKIAKGTKQKPVAESATVISSEVVYQGKLFRVTQDRIIEPGGTESVRDVVRHNGSVVILAVDNSKNKKDPWIVMEMQYRHAANRYLWELPAGKLDPGEDPLAGAKRELEEETGYRARKWKPLLEYYASPGFLGESMKVFIAEGLLPGEAHPEEDERIELRLVKLSEILRLFEKGEILDGKTLSGVLFYARKLGLTRNKPSIEPPWM